VKSSHLLTLALGAALIFLALASSAQAPPKAPPPSGPTPTQTEERIKQLESRLEAAERTAASAAMEKDYITRVQKQYESYYEKAFNTTMTVFGSIGLIIAVISIVAATLSLKFFDHRVQTAVSKAQNDVTATMKTELEKLRNENVAQIEKWNKVLTEQIARLNQDVKDRSFFQYMMAQGLAAVAIRQFDHATSYFRRALKVYKACRARQLLTTREGARSVRTVFLALKQGYPDTFMDKAEQELAEPLYDDLRDELANAALRLPWLAPLIKERKQKPPTPSAPPTPNPS